MHRIPIVLGALAAFSLVSVGLLFREFGSLLPLLRLLFEIPRLEGKKKEDEEDDGSSLERDLQDVLDVMPLKEMRAIVENYAKYDSQIGETVSFVNDQQKYVREELNRISHVRLFAYVLQELGLEVERRTGDFGRFWKSLPRQSKREAQLEYGGLTGMVSQIARLIPRERVHELLCRKTKESRSFRTLLLLLKSRHFLCLCESIRGSNVLQRNYHWAKESGLEVIFAIDMLGDFYAYLTQDVI